MKWPLLYGISALSLVIFVMAQAEAPATFQWDASVDAATAPANNPVKYRLYVSSTLPAGTVPTGATMHDTALLLEHQVSFPSGTFYVFATAYWNALTVDGVPIAGSVVESGLSNVLKVEVKVPPGNPRNARFKVTGVAQSQTGQTVGFKRRG
jgi:hypothetical protein